MQNPNSVPDSPNSWRENCSTTKTRCYQFPLPASAGIKKSGVTFHLGILLTGSPQDPYMLACWPHSPDRLPALIHPSDSTCHCVNPKPFLCLTHFPAVGTPSLCLRRAAINRATPCSHPQRELITEEGALGAMRPRDSVCLYRAYRNEAVRFTSLGLIPRCFYCYFQQ